MIQALAMHGSSNNVIQLALHLEHHETVRFTRGTAGAALARQPASTLIAAMTLYRTDPHAAQYLYEQLPEHYVYNRR